MKKHYYIASRERFDAIQATSPLGARMRALGALWNEAYEATGAGPEDVVTMFDEHEKELGTSIPAIRESHE